VRLLFLTRYAHMGASSRYRFLQYIPWLEREGMECVVSPLFDDDYLVRRYQTGHAGRVDVLKAFAKRMLVLFKVRSFDVVVVEKELLPYVPALPEWLLNRLGVPYIADYDDALFHQYDQHPNKLFRALMGNKIALVMRRSALVTAGNPYLAEYARRAGAPRVEVLPTVIDLDKYALLPKDNDPARVFTIGWIGSPSTSKYLRDIAPALAEVCAKGRARVVLVGSGEVDLPGVPVEIVPWSEATEVANIQRFDAGIMPLVDSPWERGKCGFKLIQYMACGLPVVGSPVGVNSEIVEHGVNGFLATDHADWVAALSGLRDDAALRARLGQEGRVKVERQYCLQVTAPRMAELMRFVVASPRGTD